MYCTHCGTKIPDDAAFCPKCGKKVDEPDQPAEEQKRPEFHVENSYAGGTGNNQQGTVSNVDRVMSLCKSPVTLAFTIALSLQVLFSLIGFGFSSFGSALTVLLMAVICVGCWISYVYSYKGSISPTGFSVLRVIVPIYLAFSILLSFISSILSAILSANIFVIIGIIIGYLFVIIFRIWWSVGLCTTTNHAYRILNGEPVEWRVSIPCFVIMIILVVIWVISGVAGLVTSYNAATTLYYLAYIATNVLVIVILNQIRKQQN